MPWFEQPTLLAYFPDLSKVPNEGYVMATDLWETLIRAKNGSGYSKEPDSWLWYSDQTPAFLNKMNSDSWAVVIFSNSFKVKADERILIKQRCIQMMSFLNFEPMFFISLTDDKYSKPNTGMFELFLETKIKVNPASFYMGDKNLETKKSSTSADIKFAQNVGLTFYTPEEILPPQPDFIPCSTSPTHPCKELVILMGPVGTGKSTLTNKLRNKGYVVADRAAKRKAEKYQTIIPLALSQGKSVVFDATNPAVSDRAELINMAKTYGAEPIILYFTRNGNLSNSLRPEPVGSMGIARYTKLFEEPTPSEGARIQRMS